MEHDRITVANVAKCWTKRFHPEWLRSRIAEYNRWLTPNEGDLTRWDANHVFLLLLFSVSSRFKTKKTESCDRMNQMAAGSGMKNIIALIPNVGEWGGRQCGRDHSMFCCGGRTCVWKIETKIRTERERHTHTQRGITLLSKVCATVTNEQQPLQKVTKSLYIVTHLGQLPFILFT